MGSGDRREIFEQGRGSEKREGLKIRPRTSMDMGGIGIFLSVYVVKESSTIRRGNQYYISIQ